MGKSTPTTATAELEFTKLEKLLIQTADDAAKCLKILKSNLAEYDKHHGLLFLNTSRSFMRRDIRAAKDTASELKHVAAQISESNEPSEHEITAARSKINQMSDAMLKLKKTSRAYNRKNNLRSSSGKETGSEGSWITEDSLDTSSDPSSATADTLETVVRRALSHNFSGFSALKHQLSIAEESLSPPFTQQVMDTVASMSDSLKGAAMIGTDDQDKKNSVSV